MPARVRRAAQKDLKPTTGQVCLFERRPVLARGRDYMKVVSQRKYLYRAVDRLGHSVDFLLRDHRDVVAAWCFLERAIDLRGVPDKITIDQSATNTAAVQGQLGCHQGSLVSDADRFYSLAVC